MNEEQLKLFIRSAFQLEGLADSIIRRADSVLFLAMSEVRAIVNRLGGPEDILRESQWRQALPQIAQALEPYNQAFAESTVEQLVGATAEIQGNAAEIIARSGVPVPPQAAVPVQDSIAAILRTNVRDTQKVAALFNVNGERGMSPWIKSNMRVVDQTVRKGILLGTPTNEIADEIAIAMVRNGNQVLSFSGPTAARTIRNQAKALARTTVQQYNSDIQRAVRDQNRQALDEAGIVYEWVAVLDSRTCPVCAPLDGQRRRKESGFAVQPAVHINCRCGIIAVDPEDPAGIRTGQQVSPEPFTYKGKTLDELTGEERRAALGSGLYASKAKVKGDKLFRRARPIRPGANGRTTYADYISQSDRKTQQMFFGGGNAGSIRAERFRKLVEETGDPQKALGQLINGSGDSRRFIGINNL